MLNAELEAAAAVQTETKPTVASNPGEAFKQFIESQPIITDFVCSEEVFGNKRMYFRIKKQPNALYVGRTETDLFQSEHLNDLNSYTQVFARYDNQYFLKSHRAFHSWVDTGIPDEQENKILNYNKFLDELILPRLLHMGGAQVPMGSIHWTGDQFTTTNKAQRMWVRGTVSRDEQGRVGKLLLEQRWLEAQKKKRELFPWHYQYSYETDPGLS